MLQTFMLNRFLHNPVKCYLNMMMMKSMMKYKGHMGYFKIKKACSYANLTSKDSLFRLLWSIQCLMGLMMHINRLCIHN